MTARLMIRAGFNPLRVKLKGGVGGGEDDPQVDPYDHNGRRLAELKQPLGLLIDPDASVEVELTVDEEVTLTIVDEPVEATQLPAGAQPEAPPTQPAPPPPPPAPEAAH